jgi:cardiolipin synthase A/B
LAVFLVANFAQPDLFFPPWGLVSGWLYWAGLLLAALLLPAILLSRKLPQAKMAWILAVTGFPWIGSFFYLVFGRRDLRRKLHGLRSSRARGPRPRFFQRFRLRRSAAAEMVGEVERAGANPPVDGNEFTLLSEGRDAFAAGRAAIEAATSHVHLLTYIFRNDPTGQGTLKLLAAAAARGVEVRVLYDGAGTFATKAAFFNPVREAGGKVASFLPISPFIPGLRLNLRNHRKLMIVDGAVALTGGMNIGDEYADDPKWRDVHARLRGPVVRGLQRVFAADWQLATGEVFDGARYFHEIAPAGDVPVQVVPSGPDQLEPLAPELMFGAIAAARETVDIITPYLVPTEAIEQVLRSAARRGRRVRILVPEFIESRVVRWAADSYLPRLIEAGVEVWRHPHMVHGKVMIVDKTWVTLGSTNLDMRSLFLNFELNVAMPHAATATTLTTYFEAELAAATRLQLADLDAPLRIRLARAAANILSPLL